MEQWKCKSKIQVSNDPEPSLQNSKLNSLTSERKKEKKWTFGGLLKRISKNEATENSIIREAENHQQQAVSNVIQREKNDYQAKIYIENKRNNYQDSIQSYDININLNNKKNAINSVQKNKKNRIKARLKAKRDQYCGNSSSDEQTESNNKKNSTLLPVQSEDSINFNNFRNENNKKSRAARTERYMKRLYREDTNEGNNHDSIKSRTTTDIQLCKKEKKILSDTLSLGLCTKNDTLNQQSCVKLPSRYCQSYYSDQNLENVFPRKDVDAPIDLRNNGLFHNDKYTWPQSRKIKITPIKQDKFSKLDDSSNYETNKNQPPTPPPRSSKSRIFFSPSRFSLQNSDIENNEVQNNQYFQSFISNKHGNCCNSLDRIPKRKHTNAYRKMEKLEITPNRLDSKNNHHIEEDPIIPKIKPRLNSNISGVEKSSLSNKKLEHRRHSKNLEEALLELETLYNSLRLSDENLLDRAEQRSMEEYRSRVTTTALEGSIKSLSDTSSSYELSCRHANFDRCHDCDTRLKDDMAYRRMHQNDRPPSIDPSQSSLSRVSYLTASPNLGHRNVDYLIDRPKSRRGTPDLIYDDVVFRNITHANNTLKVVDPQPPFGIPLGPVTAASESDYLHVEPSYEQESQSRSLFIPKSEPDTVTDDLAFRSLRADRKNIFKDKISPCTNFLSTSESTSTPKKKRAVRSLSADLYGIIEKNSDNHTWYKEYVKLNKPSKFVRDAEKSNDEKDEENNTNTWVNKKFCDIDINGNRPKSMYQGRIQVCIPQEAEEEEEEEQRDHDNLEVDQLEMENNKHDISSSSCIQENITNYESIPAFSDQELSEYQQLCRDLECLIKKTSEKVKYMETKNNTDSRKNSLSEFIEWEKLLSQNDSCLEDKRVYEPSKLRTTEEINIEEKNSKAFKFSLSNSGTWNSSEIYSPTVEVENEQKNNYVKDTYDNNKIDDNSDSCHDNNDSNSNSSNNDNLLYSKKHVFDQTSNNSDEINQDTNSVNNSDQISSDEKKNVNDLEQINNSKVKSAFVKAHRTSTSSSPLEDHKDFNKTINSTKNSEGRETTQ